MAGIVDIPSHSVDVSVNGGTVPLTTLTGSPILASDAAIPIDLLANGANPADAATDVTVVFAFTPGPDDQILLPDNNGFDNKSIEVNVFNQSESCIDNMNNGARRVALLAGNSDSKCVKKGKGTDATACVDDPLDPKTDKKEQKLLTDFADRCDPVPAWGVNGATCCEGGANDGAVCVAPASCPGGSCVGGACISAAAETAAGAITHDTFGATVVVSADKKAAACQAKVLQRAEKLYAAHWKAFRKCKKDNFALISGDPDLVTVCLGPPQNDAKGSSLESADQAGREGSIDLHQQGGYPGRRPIPRPLYVSCRRHVRGVRHRPRRLPLLPGGEPRRCHRAAARLRRLRRRQPRQLYALTNHHGRPLQPVGAALGRPGASRENHQRARQGAPLQHCKDPPLGGPASITATRPR